VRRTTGARVGTGALSIEGGVGFFSSTWRLWAGDLGLLPLYPHAYLAPPGVQVRVAEYGFARGGYWGCNR
jgi:hypothetical protein